MGAPATGSRIPVRDGLNFNAPRVRAPITKAPKSNVNINKALDLRSSPYKGMKQVGKEDLYYGKGGLYELYTPPSAPSYPIYGIGAISGGPLYQKTGYPIGLSAYGYPSQPSQPEGVIQVGDQSFKPYTGDKTPRGFIKTDDGYDISMAYIDSKTPKYRGTRQRSLIPAVDRSFKSELRGAMDDSYGVGRFMGGGSSAGRSSAGMGGGK